MASKKKKKTHTRPLLPRPGARYTCFGDGLCCTDIHGIGPLTKKECLRKEGAGCDIVKDFQ